MLSWFEWCLYVMRLSKQRKRESDAEELHWARFRTLYTLINNAHYKKKMAPKDWIELSIDKKKKDEKPKPSLKEAKKRLGFKFNKN